jgi:hypothetical protein
LHYVDPALLGISKHDAVDGWHIDALSQASCVGHERTLSIDKVSQQPTALSRRLLARDVKVLGAWAEGTKTIESVLLISGA